MRQALADDPTNQQSQSLTITDSIETASGDSPARDLWRQLVEKVEAMPDGDIDFLSGVSLISSVKEACILSSLSDSTEAAATAILNITKSLVTFDDWLFFLSDADGYLCLTAQCSDGNITGIERVEDLDHVSHALLEETISTGQTTTAKPDGPAGTPLYAVCLPVGISKSSRGGLLVQRSDSKFSSVEIYTLELFALLLRITMIARARQVDGSDRQIDVMTIKAAPFGIVTLSSSGDIISMNSTALEIFELNQTDIYPQEPDRSQVSFFSLLPEKERSRWQYMINTACSSYGMFEEPRYVHDTGYMEKILSVRITVLSGTQGFQERVAIYVEDITEKTVMDKYIILSEKLAARGEMADTVAHKLNNLLAIIANHSEMADRNFNEKQFEKAGFNLQSVLSGILKMRLYVESMTDFSRPPISFISYDMKALIEEMLFTLRRTKRFQHVHFTIDINQDIPNLEIDVSKIQELLTGLLDNAADATFERALTEEAHGRPFTHAIGVAIDYDDKNESVTLRVTDNGSGMSDDVLKKAFLLHFTTRPAHHGIGLYNCKRIVKQHHGTVSMTSCLDQGTEVTIVLPRFQSRAAR